MIAKKITLLFLLISLVGFIAGYFLTNSYEFGFCYSNFETRTFDVSCHEYYENLANPLYYGMPALAIVFLILLFLPRAFPAWKKFAIWFIPLATLLFIFYPNPGSGDYFSPYPEQVYKWVSILYVVISIGIITFSASKPNATSSTLPN